MLKNYPVILFRNIKRNKAFSLINIGGLTLGITCSLIMFLIVKHEFSYDRFHKNGDQIYRITPKTLSDGNESYINGVPRPLPNAVREDIAGLEEVTFLSYQKWADFVVINETDDEIKFHEDRGMVYVQPNFFKIFDWEWLEGDMELALSAPNTVVLDTENAAKFFPGESPLNKVIQVSRGGGVMNLKVTGLVKQRPKNTDFPFEIFISMATMESNTDMTSWTSRNSTDLCYVLLSTDVSAESVNAQFPQFIDKHFGEEKDLTLVIQPLNEFHFNQQLGNLNNRAANRGLLNILSVVCVFMVVTACFNFINMSSAMAIKRAKEVGIRKVLGSSRKQLIRGFLKETGLITIVSVLLSLAITERLLPTVVNQWTDLELSVALLKDMQLVVYLFVLVTFIILTAGLYPAWVISAFQPAEVLRGSGGDTRRKKMGVRRTLITFQFALSQVFIFGTLIALWQMQYVRNADLGYDEVGIVTLNLPQRNAEHLNLWKGEIETLTDVINYSFSASAPYSVNNGSTTIFYRNEGKVERIQPNTKHGDDSYIDTYGIELLAGEALLESNETNRLIVNETLIKKMGVDPLKALGTPIYVSGTWRPISGVVKDFHTRSLKEEINPIAIWARPEFHGNLGVKFRPGATNKVLSDLENIWYKFYPNKDFQYAFLDQEIWDQYEKEQRFSKMLATFAIIAIVICCLGLYGLVAYMANQRTKEIGIRKVLGASVSNVIKLFSMEFTWQVAIAFLIAAPAAFYGMQGWLNGFAYRVEISPIVFAMGILLSLFITLVTVGYRSLKAAKSNPVDSLRSE